MPSDNVPAWVVTGQREDWQVGATGQAAQGMVVTFQTRSGAIGSIFVPAADYTTERVRALIDEKARHVEAIHNLRSS